MKLTEAEEERQYLLLVTAAALHARLKNPDRIDYAIDRLQRVVNRADKTGQSEIAVIARGELDVAKRLKDENTPLTSYDSSSVHIPKEPWAGHSECNVCGVGMHYDGKNWRAANDKLECSPTQSTADQDRS